MSFSLASTMIGSRKFLRRFFKSLSVAAGISYSRSQMMPIGSRFSRFFQIVYRSRIADEPSVFVACVVDSREQGQIFRQCDYVFIHSKFLLAFIQYPLFKVMPQKNGVVFGFTRHLQSLYLIKTLILQPRHNIDNVLVRGDLSG